MPRGPSPTAIAVAAFRAAYTCAPPSLAVVEDPFAQRLVPRPIGRLIGLTRGRPGLGWSLHRTLALLSAEMSTNLALRTAAIDQALRDAIERGVRQIVVLGSGLDARAWRMDELRGSTMFELDRPGAHAVKARKLSAFPLRPARHRLVPVDFEHQTLEDALRGAGFAPERPTLWLWEAVAVYLTPRAIEATLEAIASLSAPGSTLVATYTPPNLGQSGRPTLHWRIAARLAGETVRGEMKPEDLHAALAARGFHLVSDESAKRWAQRYWPPSEHHRARQWERLVVARVASDS